MKPFAQNDSRAEVTRRQFFSRCGMGLGSIALASLLGDKAFGADVPKLVNPFAPKPPPKRWSA